MFKKLNESVVYKDSKGTGYKFDLYSFDTFDDIDELVKDNKNSGLYIIAERYVKDCTAYSKLAYIGETGDYSTRDYSNHHKRKKIEDAGANEFGIHTLTVSEKKRLEIEGDLIETNNPPCNG